MIKLKSISLEFTDGQKVNLDVDGGTVSIRNGLDYNNTNPYKPDIESNGNQRIRIEAFKGSPEFLDTVTDILGTRLVEEHD